MREVKQEMLLSCLVGAMEPSKIWLKIWKHIQELLSNHTHASWSVKNNLPKRPVNSTDLFPWRLHLPNIDRTKVSWAHLCHAPSINVLQVARTWTVMFQVSLSSLASWSNLSSDVDAITRAILIYWGVVATWSFNHLFLFRVYLLTQSFVPLNMIFLQHLETRYRMQEHELLLLKIWRNTFKLCFFLCSSCF